MYSHYEKTEKLIGTDSTQNVSDVMTLNNMDSNDHVMLHQYKLDNKNKTHQQMGPFESMQKEYAKKLIKNAQIKITYG